MDISTQFFFFLFFFAPLENRKKSVSSSEKHQIYMQEKRSLLYIYIKKDRCCKTSWKYANIDAELEKSVLSVTPHKVAS